MRKHEHPSRITLSNSPGEPVSETPPETTGTQPRTTLIVPVSTELDSISLNPHSPDRRHYLPLYTAVFKVDRHHIKYGNLTIGVEGPGEAQFQQRCQAVLDAGSIRATGHRDIDRIEQCGQIAVSVQMVG